MASNQQPNESLPPSSSFGEPLGFIDEVPESSSNQQQQQQPPQAHNEDIVQVVYQSNPNGSLVGVETSLLTATQSGYVDAAGNTMQPYESHSPVEGQMVEGYNAAAYQQQPSRATSTLPSVAEESSGSAAHVSASAEEQDNNVFASEPGDLIGGSGVADGSGYVNYDPTSTIGDQQQQYYPSTDPIYSRVNKPPRPQTTGSLGDGDYAIEPQTHPTLVQSSSFGSQSISKHPIIDEQIKEEEEPQLGEGETLVSAEVHHEQQQQQQHHHQQDYTASQNQKENDEDLSQLLFRPKGVAESGSFRNNFRKKLGISVSSNETDLTTHRQKFLQSQEVNSYQQESVDTLDQDVDSSTLSVSKFKRTHSVSFNVNEGRGNRHSIDIRNLPSYLTVKRASVVDLAKGAMSSLIHSLSAGGGGSGSGGSHRRDSSDDDEPIFEEAIAPTLSLGQRVALVKNNGSEFGTVGWIGQLPEVDDDWIVGVIFDNMIGNCDGAYNGQRYFYARENYAMFVPLSALTKTDNYIGRPETGTMLSRMSVSLKPGQLISIQRSSIRLQHCFLNAPHQRVGHDVRAVSNRLHCQCHNCGPCAHLTKQSRANVIPHFGAHHIHASAHQKKNSLAHAAVEILTHHHHHFHEDEAHEEEDYQFGDNAAHACNFVRYSCCQQSGQTGHEFSSDCGLVRPELLDNLIHAPKAPHRRSRPRRRKQRAAPCGVQQQDALAAPEKRPAIESNQSTLASGQTGTMVSASSYGQMGYSDTMTTSTSREHDGAGSDGDDGSEGRSSGGSMSDGSSSGNDEGGQAKRRDQAGDRIMFSPNNLNQPPAASGGGYQAGSGPGAGPGTSYQQYDQSTTTTTYQQNLNVYNTLDSQVSYMDQARYIYQRDSSAMIPSQRSNVSEDSYELDHYERRGFVSSIRKCFSCMLGRNQASDRRSHGRGGGRRGGGRRRKKKRKTSLRDRIIEYRRKQSTFVPSTLAKPQEDFASHGLLMPPPGAPLSGLGDPQPPYQNNSDYSSQYSGHSSRSSSQGSHRGGGGAGGGVTMQQYHGTMEHSQAPMMTPIEQQQLKSGPTLNYNDYTFDDRYGGYGGSTGGGCKDGETDELKSQYNDSTDLGFCERSCCTNSSNDTLKSLVDKSINEEVSPLEPLVLNNFEYQQVGGEEVYISPLSSAASPAAGSGNYENEQVVDISSPTATMSVAGEQPEEDLSGTMDELNLEDNNSQH